MEEYTRTTKIAKNFSLNIHSLVVFAEIIGNFADEHDRKVKNSFGNLFVDLASAFEEVISSDEETSNLDSEENKWNEYENLSIEQKRKLTEKFKIVVTEKKQQILDFNRQYGKAQPIQGNLLRRTTLVSLMSTLETLISHTASRVLSKVSSSIAL